MSSTTPSTASPSPRPPTSTSPRSYTAGDDWLLHFDVGYTKAEGDTESQPFVEFGAPAAFRYDLRGSTPQRALPQRRSDAARTTWSSTSPRCTTSPTTTTSSTPTSTPRRSSKRGRAEVAQVRRQVHRPRAQDRLPGDDLRRLLPAAPRHRLRRPRLHPGRLRRRAHPRRLPRRHRRAPERSPATGPSTAAPSSASSSAASAAAASPTRPRSSPSTRPPTAASSWRTSEMRQVEGQRRAARRGDRPGVHRQRRRAAPARSPTPSATSPTSRSTARYTDYLPSVNFSLRSRRPELVLRLAAARTMARPDYTDVSPRVTLNEGALTGQGGDPDVDPYRANQLDVSLERYRGKDSILSAALFYKDIESFITDRPVQQAPPDPDRQPEPLALHAGVHHREFPNRYSCQFTINQRANGGGGKVKGLGAEPAAAARRRASACRPTTPTPTPRRTTRAGDPRQLRALREPHRLLRELPLRRRLAYSYRSEFFVTFDRSTRFNQDELKSLDASLAFNLFREPLVHARRRQPDQRGDPAVRLRQLPPARGVRQRAVLLHRLPLEELIPLEELMAGTSTNASVRRTKEPR